MRPLSALRRYVALLSLSAGAVVLVLLVAEVGLRVFAPGQHIPQREYDERLGWRGRPKLDCQLRERLFTISISQNSSGFRDRERTRDKQPGSRRIMCLGDSFTWGWGVEAPAIYTHVLEEALEGGDTQIEVMNAGVGGYGTDQLLIYLREEALDYSPDLVLYQVARNDIRGNTTTIAEGMYNKPRFVLRDDGELVIENCPVPPLSSLRRVKYMISRRSRFAYFLKHRIHLGRHGVRRPGAGAAVELKRVVSDRADYPFMLFCSLVREMRDECEAGGAKFATLLGFRLSEEQLEYWHRECDGVETHFLREYLLELEETSDLPAFIEDDGHWTEQGHWWVAEYIRLNVLPTAAVDRNQSDPRT